MVDVWYERGLRQTATHWVCTGRDMYNQPTFDDPEAISVRWEDRAELFIDDEGREVRSLAVVYTESDVDIEDYLYLGETDNADPTSVDGAKEVRQFAKTPDVKGRKFERKAWL